MVELKEEQAEMADEEHMEDPKEGDGGGKEGGGERRRDGGEG